MVSRLSSVRTLYISIVNACEYCSTAVGNRRGRMYEVTARRPTETISLTEETKEIWHKRLSDIGHSSDSSLKKLESLVTGITSVKLDSNVCEICMQGKQCKLPHNQQRVRANRPLQLVHSDLCGPISPESYDRRRYTMTFVDDYTHFTVVYLLQSKSEAFKYFKIYEAMSTAHFNTRLSRFRCDNGREYISTEMKNYFEEKGIQFEFTMRYTPQQNGVAERINRTIQEKARCMLLSSGLNKRLWNEAILVAVFIINHSTTITLKNCVPAEF